MNTGVPFKHFDTSVRVRAFCLHTEHLGIFMAHLSVCCSNVSDTEPESTCFQLSVRFYYITTLSGLVTHSFAYLLTENYNILFRVQFC